MAIDERLAVRLGNLEALPIHSPQRYSRVSLDPRLARQFIEFTSIPTETRQALAQHVITAKWSAPERAIWSAVSDGFTTEAELETVTGLTPTQVKSTVGKLEKKGVLRRISSV